LHQNAFGGRAPPGPAGGAIALPRLPSRYQGRGEKGRGGKGREGEGRKGRGREGRGGEGEQGGGEGKGKGKGEGKGEGALEPPSKKSGYGPASSCRFIISFFGSVLYQAHCFEEND